MDWSIRSIETSGKNISQVGREARGNFRQKYCRELRLGLFPYWEELSSNSVRATNWLELVFISPAFDKCHDIAQLEDRTSLDYWAGQIHRVCLVWKTSHSVNSKQPVRGYDVVERWHAQPCLVFLPLRHLMKPYNRELISDLPKSSNENISKSTSNLKFYSYQKFS